MIEPELDPVKGLSRKDIRSKYFKVFHKTLPLKFEDSIIQQMEAAGLIQQEPDPDDRRKMLVFGYGYHRVLGEIYPHKQIATKFLQLL